LRYRSVMTKAAKKPGNGKAKAHRSAVPPGMLMTRSGRFIAKPVGRGTIPIAKIRAAIEKIAKARGD
jgi:hypothetical protein